MLPYIFLTLHGLFALLIFFLVLAFITGAPYVPSTRAAAQSMIDLAHIKRGMIVYDLGSGDGKLLLLAAQKNARVVGIEINPFLVLLSKIRTRGKNISVHWGSFWHAQLGKADVVFVYLLPGRMNQLSRILEQRCKPGTLIVSNSFVFPLWKILRQDRATHVFVFQVPRQTLT